MTAIGIADLKAHLSEHLRAVRKGRSLTVLDRDTPVAMLVPVEAGPLAIRKATRRPSDVAVAPRTKTPTDSLSILLADRERR